MKRMEFKSILKELGYADDSIKSITSGRMKPTANKMFLLEDKFNIPLGAWRDIKSYLQNNTTNNKKSEQVHKGVN